MEIETRLFHFWKGCLELIQLWNIGTCTVIMRMSIPAKSEWQYWVQWRIIQHTRFPRESLCKYCATFWRTVTRPCRISNDNPPVILVHAPLTIAAGLGGSGVFSRPRLLISISLSWRLYLIIFFVLLRTVHPALSTPPSQMSAKYFPLGPSKFMIQINFASVRRFFLRSKPTQVCHCQFRQQVLHWRGWCWSCH